MPSQQTSDWCVYTIVVYMYIVVQEVCYYMCIEREYYLEEEIHVCVCVYVSTLPHILRMSTCVCGYSSNTVFYFMTTCK